MGSANADKAAELFDLHFNRVYDFCLRVLGMPDAAADAAEESFRNALAAPPAAGSFDIRLFSAALDALEPRLKLRHPSAIGSNPLFHQVDVARLADTTRAPSAQETAGLIWETMSRLDPADYVLLDLRFRQNLDEADLAAILKTNERAINSRLSKLLKRTEPELSSLIVGRRGSRNCEGMRRAMLGLPIAATRGQVRKAVEKHARSCPMCTATRAGLASPLSVMAAFSLVTLSSSESEAARGRLIAAAAALPPIVTTVAAVKPPPLTPVAAMGGMAGAGGIGSAAGGMGGGISRTGIGFGDPFRRFFSKLQFSNGMALPIVGALVVFAVAIAIAFGSGMFGGSGATTKATKTPTATRTPAATATPKPTKTPTTEPSPTEEPATATPEPAVTATHTPSAASATPQPVTPSPEVTATPEATEPPTPTHTPNP
jgi:DNA-directed RNA polymerase specialized sigma24 family protein